MRASPLRSRYSWPAATLACLALQTTMAACAHAAPVYRCAGAHGETTFQSDPCAISKDQGVVDLHEQPLIDPSAPPVATHPSSGDGRPRKVATIARAHKRAEKIPMSYECSAADGEVFYRHSRCPGAVKGDGVARFGMDTKQTSSHRRRGRDAGAWGEVKVTARKIPRAEACQQINALTASGRDGHDRDEQVSVYEHDAGRDPCDGV